VEINDQLKSMESGLKDKISEIEKNVTEKNEGRLKELKSELERQLSDYTGKVKEEGGDRQKQLDAVETKLKTLEKAGMNAKNSIVKSLHEILAENLEAESESFKNWAEKGSFKNGAPSKEFSLKAAGTMTFGSNTTGNVVNNAYLPGIFGTERRNTRIRNFIPTGSMTGSAINYVVQSGGEGGANNVNEGSTKPTTDKDVILKTAPARKIAHNMRVSEEMVNDLQGLSAFLTFQGIEDLYDKEDQQLLYGTGSGTPTQLEGLTVGGALTAASTTLTGVQNPQKVDALIAAMEALAQVNYMADTIIMNPADVYGIQVLKESAGNYLNRVNFTTDGRLVINGIVVGLSTAVTAGDVVVANMAKAALMLQRDAPSVRFYDQDQDNAIKNLITIVIEERIALAKPYQNAIFYDSFADVITAIS